MTKYSKEKEVKVLVSGKVFESDVLAANEIHNNFSEFLRDALREKVIREQKILKEQGL